MLLLALIAFIGGRHPDMFINLCCAYRVSVYLDHSEYLWNNYYCKTAFTTIIVRLGLMNINIWKHYKTKGYVFLTQTYVFLNGHPILFHQQSIA